MLAAKLLESKEAEVRLWLQSTEGLPIAGELEEWQANRLSCLLDLKVKHNIYTERERSDI